MNDSFPSLDALADRLLLPMVSSSPLRWNRFAADLLPVPRNAPKRRLDVAVAPVNDVRRLARRAEGGRP